ncbi:MAG: D-inositol-3-phosphate glycosyltransferase [Candidatus Woesearchaeota archaeon]|nr:D-inositol-3-phosphate glycosyltransferase [Candidatus Woesearchaeota archaeon]
MLGWEFPPHHSGGLGTACFGLTKGLAKEGVNVTFVLPSLKKNAKAEFVKLVGANVKMKKVNSPLKGYMNSETYHNYKLDLVKEGSNQYGKNLMEEVARYASKISMVAGLEDFDIIHAHDWLTYPAAVEVKKKTGKPLVVHIHATEFDRCAGENINKAVYNIERKGLHTADAIIAVSNFTKARVVNNYGVDPDKITVVHNGVDMKYKPVQEGIALSESEKIVLFLGRITIQKGPEYFLLAAKKVLEFMPDTKFVIAGSGDMDSYVMQKAAEMDLGKNVMFTGFLRGRDIDRAYQMANVYVMPSVSEPFGITPLESMMNNTPAIISKQSGVSEVVNHALKVDFWDVDKLTNQIIGVLQHDCLQETMANNGFSEIFKINWNESARKCVNVYQRFA